MPNTRYQLKADVYMPLDGQWGTVGAGTVFDDATPPIGPTYSLAHVTVLSPGEPAGTLGSHGRATFVRNLNRR